MIEQNSNNTGNLAEKKPLQSMGLLEELNLPPVLADFLRKNQRTIWLVIICVVSVVVVGSVYRSYMEYRENNAATAFSEALMLESDTERRSGLESVIQEYGSTSTALWATMELVGLDLRNKKSEEALKRLSDLNGKIAISSPLKPLVLYKLALVEEEYGKVDQAIVYYKELSGIKQFEMEARKSLGAIYETQGKKKEAMEEYEQYLLLTETSQKDAMMSGNSRERDMVRSRLSNLK